jgi:hypothetical protein
MNPNILCFTDTIKVLANYAVVAFGIHCLRIVILAFIMRRAELNDLFTPRTPQEKGIDEARRNGVEAEEILAEFPTEGLEVH